MKKFIAAALVASLIATPALANHRNRNFNNHRNSGVSTGEAVAIGLGALLLGGALASNRNNQNIPLNQPFYPNMMPVPQAMPQYQYVPTVICQNVYATDGYGNYVVDRFGRVIIQRQCFQQ